MKGTEGPCPPTSHQMTERVSERHRAESASPRQTETSVKRGRIAFLGTTALRLPDAGEESSPRTLHRVSTAKERMPLSDVLRAAFVVLGGESSASSFLSFSTLQLPRTI